MNERRLRQIYNARTNETGYDAILRYVEDIFEITTPTPVKPGRERNRTQMTRKRAEQPSGSFFETVFKERTLQAKLDKRKKH